MLPRLARTGAITLLAATVVTAGATAAGAAVPRAKSNSVKVTLTDAGCPAKLKTPAGATTFKVTNKGALSHDFKIAGKRTVLLKTGKTATLRAVLKKGKYAFLCTVPGHAAAGMKGVLTVK